LFLCFDWPENEPDCIPVGKGEWLQHLNEVAPITDADGQDERAASLAFTFTGLQKMGLSPDVLATFSQPFREGMYQEDRLRRLGDRIDEAWQPTVIAGGSRWSGNTPSRTQLDAPKQAWERTAIDIGSPEEKPEKSAPTPITVHALLVLYEKTRETAHQWAKEVMDRLARHGVKLVHELPLDLQLDNNGIGREHFGFADALSQPIPYQAKEDPSEKDVLVLSDGSPVKRDEWHGVPLGEILIGHTNGHHEKALGPFVADDARARDLGLSRDGAADGLLNFGLDGSYLVVRELRQYVDEFWKSLEENAERIRAHDPGAAHVTADWLAERVIGRSKDGHLLCPAGFLKPNRFNQPDNDFLFKRTDPDGHGCPAGSHVRRANPRDTLAKDLASAQTLLDAANNHRILRRGRKYGKQLVPGEPDDGTERGLLFMCLNSDIARQFEFVQQVWLLNKNFATLFDETDPLLGPEGGFTIKEKPLRRIVTVKTFVQMAGGEYFFLPSMPAIRYLAALSADYPKAGTP
jgi:Dyp-type peroxidase family